MDETEQKSVAGAGDYAAAEGEISSYQVDADQVHTLDACDKHIEFLKEEVVKRSRLLERTQQAKKDVMAGWRDVLKVQKESLTDSHERLGAMEDRKRVLAAGSSES
jgi:glutamate synthase domain-containing protein 1